MRYCEHENVTFDIVGDPSGSGHVVSCNACGRWWRYHRDWRVGRENLTRWERPEAHGSPQIVHVGC